MLSEKLNKVVLREVPNYPDYLVDCENGIIYTQRTGEQLKQLKTYERPEPHNYCTVTLTNDEGSRTLGVHEVIMAADISSWHWKDEGLEPDHINEKKNQNGISNLKLVTHSEQYTESVRAKMSEKKKGSAHPRATLNEEQAKMIREQYMINKCTNDELLIDFVERMSDKYGTSEGVVYSICYGRSWTHV